MSAADARALATWERALENPPEEGDSDTCSRPGRYGCGVCLGCEVWADAAADYEREG